MNTAIQSSSGNLHDAVHLAQIEVTPNQPAKNVNRMKEVIANTPEGDLIVFPEMCIPGYMIGDDWLKETLVKDFVSYNDDIYEALEKNGNSAIWGNVELDTEKKNDDGTSRKYNAAYISEYGKHLEIKRKMLLPNYRMFDDKRYFESLKRLAKEEGRELSDYCEPVQMQVRGQKIEVAALICEDIWNINGDYDVDPVELVRQFNPDLLAVLSTSPFGRDKAKFRDSLLTNRSRGTTLAYVNPVGIQDIGKNIHAMDGGSSVYVDGEFVRGVQDFTENTIIETLNHTNEIEQAYDTITYSLRKFWEQIGEPKMLIGLSGGIDSGVVAALLRDAIGAENIIAINMPSKFNTDLTKGLAGELAENLGIPEDQYIIFPIQEAVDLKISEMEKATGQKLTDFEIENIQARERGQILSDFCGHYGGVHTCNGNKDETALGYATLYGDISGAISPIGDLHKYQVFEMARFINKKHGSEVIPTEMIEMKPSAELSDAQNPEKGGGDPFNYDFIGKTLKALGERKLIPEDLLAWYKSGTYEEETGMDEKLSDIFATPAEFIDEIEKTWNGVYRAYFKRVQGPPIITVNKASYGFDFREAQTSAPITRRYKDLKKEILGN